MNHIKTGALGEEIALNYLKKNKYRLLDRNYRKKYGEIDLVVSKNKIVYFVEVKTMLGAYDRDNLIEKIHKNKISRLKRAIHVYLSENKMENYNWRLSAVLISLNNETGQADLEFIKNFY